MSEHIIVFCLELVSHVHIQKCRRGKEDRMRGCMYREDTYLLNIFLQEYIEYI